eukprot:7385831-Prymnesium_polylepis.10
MKLCAGTARKSTWGIMWRRYPSDLLRKSFGGGATRVGDHFTKILLTFWMRGGEAHVRELIRTSRPTQNKYCVSHPHSNAVWDDEAADGRLARAILCADTHKHTVRIARGKRWWFVHRPLTNLDVLCLPHARTHTGQVACQFASRGVLRTPETGEVDDIAIAIFAQRRPDAEASNYAHSICAMRWGMRLSARRTPKHAWHFTWWRDRHKHECEHVLKELDPLARRCVPRERSVRFQALDPRPLDVGPICEDTRERGRSEERERD